MNLGIHLFNGLLIFLLSYQILRVAHSRFPSNTHSGMNAIFPAAVAAAWLLAPINLTGVLYVVQRMESLSTLFMLLGLLAYLHGRAKYEAAGRGDWPG